jgi:Zn-finger nucleic acid-binding protein
MYDLGSVLYSYFPEEFDPNPVAEDRVPTERSERRINHFIAQHTEPLTAANTTSTTNTDCPICMEDATAHDCVKIKGIVGCEHMIGQNCLKEFLSRQWNKDKTCPLCRAVWLRNGVWEDVAAQSDGPTGRQGASFGHGNRNRRERGMDRVRGLLRSARGQQRRRNN